MSEDSRDAQKQAVVVCVQALRDTLAHEPLSDAITQARHQCDRLEQGLVLAHPEGIRFAAHTLLRLIDPARGATSAAVAEARRRLKDALAAGGFPH